MKQYELLPHTADVAVRARGSSKAELLTAAVQGMFAAAEPQYVKNGEEIERPFEVAAEDFPSLLVAVLNEAIFHAGTRHEAYDDVNIASLAEMKAHGILKGRPITGFGTEIKAATYHDLSVEKKNGTWQATVIFDT